MRKKIVIGSDLNPLHNSICLWYFGHASENKLFYILTSDYAEVFIHKDSEEAVELKEWLSVEENRNNESVHKKVMEYLLPRITVDEFAAMIDNEKNLSWEEGYAQAQRDIRAALGMGR
jgi:hypothetical protein